MYAELANALVTSGRGPYVAQLEGKREHPEIRSTHDMSDRKIELVGALRDACSTPVYVATSWVENDAFSFGSRVHFRQQCSTWMVVNVRWDKHTTMTVAIRFSDEGRLSSRTQLASGEELYGNGRALLTGPTRESLTKGRRDLQVQMSYSP